MTSGTIKRRKKIFNRAPLGYELQLLQRDLDVLISVAEYRLLTSAQLTCLHWPPSVVHKLKQWHIDQRQAQEFVWQTSTAIVNERIELMKWMLRVKAVRSSEQVTSPSDSKLRDWLWTLEKSNPTALAELDWFVQSIAEIPPRVWLVQAIQQEDFSPPEAFYTRPGAEQERISRACTQRLRLLYDAGYLERVEQATKLSEGRAPLLWGLTEQGLEKVIEVLKKTEDQKKEYRLDIINAAPASLPHFIKTNDIRIAITLDAQHHGFEIVEWRDDLTLRRFHQRPSERVTVKFHQKKVTFGLVPDGYFWLLAGQRGHGHFFIECDLATVVGRYSQAGLKDWERKVSGYGQYYKTRYTASYPEAKKSMRILVVTTGQTRLNNLRSITQKTAETGAHRYFFTTFNRLKSGSALTGKIWERAFVDGLHAIV